MLLPQLLFTDRYINRVACHRGKDIKINMKLSSFCRLSAWRLNWQWYTDEYTKKSKVTKHKVTCKSIYQRESSWETQVPDHPRNICYFQHPILSWKNGPEYNQSEITNIFPVGLRRARMEGTFCWAKNLYAKLANSLVWLYAPVPKILEVICPSYVDMKK